MEVVRICLAVVLTVLLGGAGPAEPGAEARDGLFDRPVLVVDPDMHTAMISSASADQDGRWAVTSSLDEAIRVWSLTDGSWARTIRLPEGPGDVGKVYAVAISPDDALIAAGGWTRIIDADHTEQLYLLIAQQGHSYDASRAWPAMCSTSAFRQTASASPLCLAAAADCEYMTGRPAGQRRHVTRSMAAAVTG